MSLVLTSTANCSSVPQILITARYAGVTVKHEVAEGKGGFEGHPFKKSPVLKVGEEFIFETNAISRFIARSGQSNLFGTTPFEEGEIESWIDLAANQIDLPLSVWTKTISGEIPNDPEAFKKAIADVRKVLVALDAHLSTRTFLVRDRLTLADISVSSSLLPAYRIVLDPGFRKAFKNTNRWFLTCVNQPIFVSVLGEVALCDKKAVPPAGEAKKEQPKKEQPKKEQPKKEQPKKEQKKDDDDEDEDPAVAEPPKKKPFSDLPPSPFNMNAFKVAYSNEDYRSVSLPHFYQHFDPQGWCLWFADYKYPEDLQKLFMVSNLLGGFCQRSDHIRDFAFGSFLIFGEENNYEVHGALLLRGTVWPADVMGEIPDCDSYDFRKVDLNNPEDKEWFEDLWGWDGKLKGKKFTGSGKILK